MNDFLFFIVYGLFMVAVTGFCQHALRRDAKSFSYATISSLIGFLCLTVLLISQLFTSGIDTVLLTNWIMVVIYYYAAFKTKNRLLGTVFMPIVLILLTIAVFTDGINPVARSTYEGQLFLSIHQGLLMVAFAIFFFTFSEAVLYLVKVRALKNHKQIALDDELPSLDRLKNVFVSSFNWGWSAMTLGIAFAFIFTLKKQGGIVNEVKITWGIALWLIYTALFTLYNLKKITIRNLARSVTALFIAFLAFYGFISTMEVKDPKDVVSKEEHVTLFNASHTRGTLSPSSSPNKGLCQADSKFMPVRQYLDQANKKQMPEFKTNDQLEKQEVNLLPSFLVVES